MKTVQAEGPLDPALASAGAWRISPTHQTIHDGARLPTYAVLTGGGAQHHVGRAHPLNGRPEDLATVRMNARLFAASKKMAALLLELLAYQAEQFDGPDDRNLILPRVRGHL